MTDFLIFLAAAFVMIFVMIGAAVFFVALVIAIAEFGRELKEDLRRRKEKKGYEKNKTSEEKSTN